MVRLLTLLAILASTPALADDEASEHTARLIGDDKDTLGVTVDFDEKAGWSMKIRKRPGADMTTVALPQLPKHHAHYVVYVTPGRTAVAFIETSMGTTKQRPTIAANDKLSWTFNPDGRLIGSWTYGKVLTKTELASPQRSVSHVMWQSDVKLDGSKGLVFTVAQSGNLVRLDSGAKKFTR